MTFEVQNGIVQSRNSADLHRQRADVEGQEIGDREADHQREDPDVRQKRSVER